MPHQLVGVLLRYHRIRAGLSCLRAGQLAQITPRRLQDMELARSTVSGQIIHALLHAYGAPAQDVQSAIALMPRAGGHRHQIGAATLQDSGWVPALKAGARETVILSTGPLTQVVDLAAPATRGSGSAQHHRRTVLLLHESVLGRAPAEQLASLVRLINSKALTVRLVPAAFAAPVGVLTEWTLTAWSWDGTASERTRRQLYVTHLPQQPPVGRNGDAATADRQLVQAAMRRSLPPPASAHHLLQAMQRPRSWASTGGRRSPSGTAADAATARGPA
ncbi:helix-turn-helix domain-containing protein [Streptomyces cinerochromogenes]|uniref:helix-turn-helix domain-containing protein n=1 Tax=Streptomyces cinerochromogenes TaxID=66422 RepID=UPI0036ACD1A5